MRQVEAVHAAVIVGVLPLATAAVGAWLHRQRPAPAFWLCAALGSALVVSFAILRSGGRGLSIHPADLLLLGAAACAAVGYAWGARLSQRMRAEHVICWALVIALPLTVPAALLTRPQSALQASAWWGFAYVALFSMWLGFFAWYRGLALGGTVRVEPGPAVPAVHQHAVRRAAAGRDDRCAQPGLCHRGDRNRVRRQENGRAHATWKDPMKLNDLPNLQWVLARRADKMNPSVIREILKVTERPGIISFAGGLPSPRTFPVVEFAAACAKVLRDDGPAALQYAASEGYGPLREMVAAMLPWQVDPAQVLITTGSQQGLDLVAKILIDAGSRVLVETPTYLGALQAFSPMEPEVLGVASDDEGVLVDDLAAANAGTRGTLSLPAAEFPEPHRPHHERGPPRRLVAPRGRTGLADRRRQPLRRPVVRRCAAAAPDRPQSGRLRLPGVVLQGPGTRPATGLHGRAQGALPQAVAGQAGRRPAQPRLQPAHDRRGDEGRIPGPPCAHHPRALQVATRRDGRRVTTAK